jgi:diaminohydroxyphosphoribosylaminopyrimidine deaminase / 5-amino-6-(5-phosphoribosylamino)uracil reductase
VNEHDIRFMEHALTLARKGVGLASPNPTVGCVVVRDGQIVGEGFHQYERRDHAEIVALKSARERARGATLYVTLEPCNHAGRTGPCTEAIITAGVQRVVAAMEDPNPVNSGRGFARLGEAGIEVVTDICEEGARRLNEAFACWIRTKKPFVTLKSAMTLDGQLALPQSRKKGARGPGKRGRSEWISSEESRAEVHRVRHASDGLLTGIGTILADDPLLTDRSGLPRRRRLLRVVLDSKLRLPPKSRLVETANDDLVVFAATSPRSAKARTLQKAGVEVVRAKTKAGRIDLRAVLAELGRREILSVLLEAGPTLNGAALAAGIVHKLFLFYAPKIAGVSGMPLAVSPNLKLPALQPIRTHQFGPDFAIEAYLRDVYRK